MDFNKIDSILRKKSTGKLRKPKKRIKNGLKSNCLIILVLEPNDVEFKVLSFSLQGHEYIQVKKSKKAASYFKKYKPNLIFMNISFIQLSTIDPENTIVDEFLQFLIEEKENSIKTCSSFPYIVLLYESKIPLIFNKYPLKEIIWKTLLIPTPGSILKLILLRLSQRQFRKTIPDVKTRTSMETAALTMSIRNDKSTNNEVKTISKTLQVNETSSIPYTIYFLSKENEIEQKYEVETFDFIVVNDFFETFQYYERFFKRLVKQTNCKVLLFNLPGQVSTTFEEKQQLNNTFNAFCLSCLLEETEKYFKNSFYLVGFGNGANIVFHYILTCFYFTEKWNDLSTFIPNKNLNLAGLILINPYFKLNSKLVKTLTNLLNLFACIPEDRNDLPLYSYCKFIFSKQYLKQIKPIYAINLYSSVFNGITLSNRKQILKGILKNDDSFDSFKELINTKRWATDIKIICSNSYFVEKNEINEFTKLIPKDNIELIILKGGHELIQERKKDLFYLFMKYAKGENFIRKTDVFEYKSNKISFSLDKSVDLGIENTILNSNSVDVDLKSKSVKKHPMKVEKVKQEKLSKLDIQILLDPSTRLFEKAWNKRLGKGGKNNLVDMVVENSKLVDNTKVVTEYREFISWRIEKNEKLLLKLVTNCIILQCFIRQYLAKKHIRFLRETSCAIVVQRSFRAKLARIVLKVLKHEKQAVIFVQKNWRGKLGRNLYWQKKIEKKSAVLMQKTYRMQQDYMFVKQLKARSRFGAKGLQKLWRGYKGRVLFYKIKRKKDSSCAIQRVFRGMIGRKKYKTELNKYLFSVDQRRGITYARRLLIEYKVDQKKLNAEISLLKKNFGSSSQALKNVFSKIDSIKLDLEKTDLELAELDNIQKQAGLNFDEVARSDLRIQRLSLAKWKNKLLAQHEEQVQHKVLQQKQCALFEAEIKAKRQSAKELEDKLVFLLLEQKKAVERLEEKRLPSVNRVTAEPRRVMTVNSNQPVSDKLLKITDSILKFNLVSSSSSYLALFELLSQLRNSSTGNETIEKLNKQVIGDNQQGNKPVINLESWNIEEVIRLLKELKLEQYIKNFESSKVDGNLLLHLTDNDLQEHLYIDNPLHRKKILIFVRKHSPKIINLQETGRKGKNLNLQEVHKEEEKVQVKEDEYEVKLVPKEKNKQIKVKEEEKKEKSKEKNALVFKFDTLVNHVKFGRPKELKKELDSVEDELFNTGFINEQFVDGVGTEYTPEYNRDLWTTNSVDEKGNTLLILSCQNGSKKIAKLLVTKGAYVDHQNKQGQTALHYAMTYKFYELGAFLVEAGADDSILNVFDLSPYDGLTG